MKKVKFLLWGLLALAPLLLSCSSDDDDEPQAVSPEGNIAKQWTEVAAHDYNLLVGTMENYLSDTYGERGEIFNNYNKYSVDDGRTGTQAISPTFSTDKPMLLVSVHTYHYFLSKHSDGSSVISKGITSWLEDEHGKAYGTPAYNYWCYGQGKFVGSCWNSFPMVKLPAGTYTVKCSHPESWSYNSTSGQHGFAVVHAVDY